jgi:2-methylisocitrate lyase-like PEP mutase family enzyme
MLSQENNARALRLRSLQTPGSPLVLTNVYDGQTARIALRNGSKALATSSYAVASVRGKRDEDLTPEILLSATHDIMSVIQSAAEGVPLSVDMRDGWGDRLESVTASLIQAGAVGCNLEDEDGDTGHLMPIDTAKDRVARTVREASRQGVPDFAVNARTDVLLHGGSVEEAIVRGREYLAAGAATVFVWGGNQRGVSREEVEKLVHAFEGRLNARLRTGPGHLTVAELSEMGVARISLGRELQDIAMEAYEAAVGKLLS